MSETMAGRPPIAKQNIYLTSLVNDVNRLLDLNGRGGRMPIQKFDPTCVTLAKEFLENRFKKEYSRFIRLRRPQSNEFPKSFFKDRYTIVLLTFLWAHSFVIREYEASDFYLGHLERSIEERKAANPESSDTPSTEKI